MFRRLSSWGHFPSHPQTAHEVRWRGEMPALLAQLRGAFGTTLAFGNGRSYGDSCLAATDHVIHTAGLDRFVSADWSAGVLTVEAGITLGQILSVCVPKGWFLPVLPGTKCVSVGGAVANDIHGKNHHVRGTFGRHVRKFGLIRTDCGRVECGPLENSDLFCATVGGLGLTGIIEWVELQLSPIASSTIDVTTCRYDSLEEFFTLSDEFDSVNEFAVSWVDCLATGASMGRGVYSAGNHRPAGDLFVDEHVRRPLKVPLTPPFSMVNRFTVKGFNAAYYRKHAAGRIRSAIHFNSFFFPLDRIHDWNRLYGRAGFQQYQCVLPERDAQAILRELLGVIAGDRNGSFLAVMKRCGNLKSPGLMSFPLAGVSLALDFPQHTGLQKSLFPRLDTIVREGHGRLYPAKDAHMSGTDFRGSYPSWEAVEALRDPSLNSRFWQRVTIQ